MKSAEFSKNSAVYTILYQAWKSEKEESELQTLDKEFLVNISQYIGKLQEELQILDEMTLKARLLSEENERIKRILRDLMITRYKKMYNVVVQGKTVSSELLTYEEEHNFNGIVETWNNISKLLKDILRGRPYKISDEKIMKKPKRILVRFLQAIPAIVGPDMNVYGPFKEEDVAYLPIENAEVLIDRGVVKEI